VLEQNFQYDLVSAERILDRYRDRDLTVMGKDARRQPARFCLMTVRPGARPQAGIAIVNRTEVKEIQFSELPGGLIAPDAGLADRQRRRGGATPRSAT
jgi:hypothetical protein